MRWCATGTGSNPKGTRRKKPRPTRRWANSMITLGRRAERKGTPLEEPVQYNARMMGRFSVAAALAVTIVSASAPNDTASVEWRYYSGDNGAKKYSPLDRLNK